MEEFSTLAEWEHAIADYFTLDNRAADYEYDFGDGWQHEVVFEAILPREMGIRYPIGVDGRVLPKIVAASGATRISWEASIQSILTRMPLPLTIQESAGRLPSLVGETSSATATLLG